MSTIAILIPCYNEESTISKVIEDIRRDLTYDAEIYVCDNNSTDETAYKARFAGAHVSRCSIQGKGATVRKMLSEIKADIYVMIDGDDTYDTSSMDDLIHPIVSGQCDLVLGDRLTRCKDVVSAKKIHGFGNSLVQKLLNNKYNVSIPDYLTGYRAFSKEFIQDYYIKYYGFELEVELDIHALKCNYSIQSIPINYKERPNLSKSKVHTVVDGVKILNAIKALT